MLGTTTVARKFSIGSSAVLRGVFAFVLGGLTL